MPAHDGKPLFLVAHALPDEFGVSADRRNGPARGAQNNTDGEPFNIVFAVQATATGTAFDRIGKNALALIETKRVNAQAGAFGDLADAQLAESIVWAIRRPSGVDVNTVVVRPLGQPVRRLRGCR
jgi:hypothetical protein